MSEPLWAAEGYAVTISEQQMPDITDNELYVSRMFGSDSPLFKIKFNDDQEAYTIEQC